MDKKTYCRRILSGLLTIILLILALFLSRQPIILPFVIGSKSRSQAQGHGLGLAIVKSIIDMYGFCICIDDMPYPYTKAFVVTIPLESLSI